MDVYRYFYVIDVGFNITEFYQLKLCTRGLNFGNIKHHC